MNERTLTHKGARVRISASLVAFAGITLAYIGTLLLLDARGNVFANLGQLSIVLLALVLASLTSYILRYWRWRWLLSRQGYKIGTLYGFLAYLAGFAFTASPGKVGELVRIRYLARRGVPYSTVIACFIFERLLDLIVLLVFASFIATSTPGFALLPLFVVIVLAVALAIANLRTARLSWRTVLIRIGLLPTRVLRFGLRGFNRAFDLLSLSSLTVSAGLGTVAWGVQCAVFAMALGLLGIALPQAVAFALQPAAMLFGAFSMVPGGLGTTEGATVILLTYHGIELELAVLAAVAMRVGSLWFAILAGLGAILVLESLQSANGAISSRSVHMQSL